MSIVKPGDLLISRKTVAKAPLSTVAPCCKPSNMLLWNCLAIVARVKKEMFFFVVLCSIYSLYLETFGSVVIVWAFFK